MPTSYQQFFTLLPLPAIPNAIVNRQNYLRTTEMQMRLRSEMRLRSGLYIFIPYKRTNKNSLLSSINANS